jgi:hypothetical protein
MEAVRGGRTTCGEECRGRCGEEGGRRAEIVPAGGAVVEVVATGVGECILLGGEGVSGEVVCGAESGGSRREMRTIGETGRAGWGRGNRARRVCEGEVVVAETGSL